MVSSIVSLSGLFVAGVAWLASNNNTDKNNNKEDCKEEKNSKDNNGNNFLDLSGGLLGI